MVIKTQIWDPCLLGLANQLTPFNHIFSYQKYFQITAIEILLDSERRMHPVLRCLESTPHRVPLCILSPTPAISFFLPTPSAS